MKLLRIFAGSYRILLAHGARSSLAAVGVALGVALVFVVSALGSGASTELLRDVERSGTQVLLVRPMNAPTLAARRKVVGPVTTLRIEDCTAIEQLGSVSAVAPVVDGQLKVGSSSGKTMTKVVGTTPNLLDVKGYSLEHGRIWSADEELSAARVAVLGALVAQRLFPTGDAVGETIRIRTVPFAVIGVLRSKGSAADGSDNDNQVLVPTRTALRRIYDLRALSFIYVRARPPERAEPRSPSNLTTTSMHVHPVDATTLGSDSARPLTLRAHPASLQSLQTKLKNGLMRAFHSLTRQGDLELAESEIRGVLRQSHRLDQRGLGDDFSIQNKSSSFKLRETLAASLSSATSALALVAFLIGGAGVAGLMLLSVQERTAEIALRIAVGARSVDIGLQFFAESMMIAIAGGALGVSTGAVGAWVVERWTEWRIEISPQTVAISFGIACLIGVVAGVLPAWRASRIPPVQAFAKE